MSFETAAKAHIASRGSPETRAIYLADLARWIAFCEVEGTSADAPSFDVAVKFRDMLVAKYAAPTVRRVLSALSSMYDATAIVNHFKSSKRLPRPESDEIGTTREFSEEEAQALLGAAREEADKPSAKGLRDYAVLRLLYDTGMRITEAVSMKRDALSRVDGKLVLVAKVKKKGRVETSIPETSAELIERWLLDVRPSKYVFPASKGLGPLARRTISKRLLVYGTRVGVKDAHPHRFRVTYVIGSLDAGLALHEIQASVHHSDPKTTLRYDRRQRGAGVSAALAEFRRSRK